MKKKILNKKLRLNKRIISSLQAQQIKGGGTGDCIQMEDSRICLPNPGNNNNFDWTVEKSQ